MKYRAFNKNSNDNSLFVTEQCNNSCIMCCQPPKKVDDIDSLFSQNMKRIAEAPTDLPVFGITGGEPTLLGDKLLVMLEAIRKRMPNTKIHLLSNGRRFADAQYARRVAEICGDMMAVGIPFHSDYERDHDIIAGAKGAYRDTMDGLYNLGALKICIELRIVMNKLNKARFLPMAQFIHRNLYFVGWTAFMGMEYIGSAYRNSENIWIEPKDYIDNLVAAVKYLSEWNYYVDIYNIPLCLLPKEYHVFARKSISDWKNKYIEACDTCSVKDECCGFFSTSKQIYQGIKSL